MSSINTKNDINKVLNENLDELAKYMQEEFSSDNCFTSKQQNKIDKFCQKLFYYLNDIKDAISLLNQ